MAIASPVRGLRPWLAGRLFVANVRNRRWRRCRPWRGCRRWRRRARRPPRCRRGCAPGPWRPRSPSSSDPRAGCRETLPSSRGACANRAACARRPCASPCHGPSRRSPRGGSCEYRRPQPPAPLDHVSVVGQAGSEEMNQKRVRRVAGHCHRCRHDAVSFVPIREIDGRTPSPGRPDRRPAHGQASPLDGERRADGDGDGTAAGHVTVGGAGGCQREDQETR